jgi:Holliday junction resolvase-like predicted endonuclease
MKLLISVLKLTTHGPASHETIKKDLRFPLSLVTELLQTLQNDGLVYLRDNIVETSSTQRLELAVRALKSGADIGTVSNLLEWREFEDMAALALEHNRYSVIKNLHFKEDNRKYEMDVIGFKKPLAVCIDCKHWHHGLYRSALEEIVEKQVERVRALTKSFPHPKIKPENVSRGILKFLPVILSLTTGQTKFHDGVPIVPVTGFQDFLLQLPAYADSLVWIEPRGALESFFNQKPLL